MNYHDLKPNTQRMLKRNFCISADGLTARCERITHERGMEIHTILIAPMDAAVAECHRLNNQKKQRAYRSRMGKSEA